MGGEAEEPVASEEVPFQESSEARADR
jgi:hypothetical protein